MMALLVAATLISSSAVSVTIGNEQETVIKDKVNENPQPLIVPTMETKIDFMSALNYNEQQSANGNRAIGIIYDNGMDYAGLAASQSDTVYNLDPVCADDFILTDAGNLTIEYVLWIGGYWNGDPGAFDWDVTIYEDDGSGYHPGNVIDTNVFANADTHETLVYSSGTSHYFEYWVELPTPVTVTVDTKYWVSCQGVGDYPPQSGFARHDTILNHQGNFKSVYFGFPNWTNASDVFGAPCDYAFQLGKWAPITNDIELVSINSPVSGDAGIFTPEVTVKNNANAQTNVPVQMTIGKITSVTVVPYYTEDFEASNGGFTVSGGVWDWGVPTSGPMGAYSGTKLWATVLGGNYPVSANCQLVTTSITVPIGGELAFWHWYDIEASYDGGNVKISTDGGTSWTVITPIGGYTGTANSANPLYPEPIFCGHVQGYWEEETFDLAAYEGMSVMFRFDFGSDGSVQYPGWYVDDVSITYEEYTVDVEFDDTVYIDIGEVATEDVTFSAWMPDDWQVSENTDVDYFVHAETQLPGDEVPDNDAKDSAVTLNFPYLHDIAVMSINDPNSGDAQTLPVEVTIKNVGQNPECCYLANVQIGKFSPPLTLLSEDFEAGYPGWTIIDGGTTTDTWSTANPAGRTAQGGCTGLWMQVDSDWAGSGLTMVEELISPVFDCSAAMQVLMDFSFYYQSLSDIMMVDVSNDGGSTWNNVATYTATTTGPITLDISAEAAGYSNVMVRFYYDNLGAWAWYTQVDNVLIYQLGGLVVEYDEDISMVTLNPGEEAILTYPDWTPDDLALGVNGAIDYQVIAEQNLPGDTNSANDILTKGVSLDYRHDVGIKEITDPSDGGKGDVIFEQLPHDPDEAWSIGTSQVILIIWFSMLDSTRTVVFQAPKLTISLTSLARMLVLD